jgi:hypothetical protein
LNTLETELDSITESIWYGFEGNLSLAIGAVLWMYASARLVT